MKIPASVSIGLVAWAALALVPEDTSGEAETSRPVTVVLLRHAEALESTPADRDPDLSEVGHQRAGALAALLSEARVTHLFASEYRRTQATLAPLARLVGTETSILAARDAEAQLAALRDLPGGSVAVVAGHSNTVPALVAALGGEIHDLEHHPQYGEIIEHTDFDRMFIVTFRGEEEPVTTLELRYGCDES